METNEFIRKIQEVENKHGVFHAVYRCSDYRYKLKYKLYPMFSKNFKSTTEFVSKSVVTILVSKYLDCDSKLKIVTSDDKIYKFDI